MKKSQAASYVCLLFALPAFATISQRQSPVSQWNSSPSSTCIATLGAGYTPGDLIAVWTFWSTGSSANNLMASVKDQVTGPPANTYVSAVGPTLQTASNTAAEIFYVASAQSHSGTDMITVTFSVNGTATNATTSGCVFVGQETRGRTERSLVPCDQYRKLAGPAAGR
jgi:hypothetical protein